MRQFQRNAEAFDLAIFFPVIPQNPNIPLRSIQQIAAEEKGIVLQLPETTHRLKPRALHLDSQAALRLSLLIFARVSRYSPSVVQVFPVTNGIPFRSKNEATRPAFGSGR